LKPEPWQQLDQVFHSALQHPARERAAFLDEACADDDSLRKQVEALLTAHEEAGSFIERPAMEVEARFVADEQNELAAGQTVGHYRIVSQLGMGGMGEVYLAEDTKLGRQVALKLLPNEFTRDTDRVRRFQQEARAASALNHPNIVTIHEMGQVDDRRFIATEFIDGETLRQHIAGVHTTADGSGKTMAPLLLHEVLNIAIQIADALAVAHEAGIVHRDIKPENIMVRRRDGYIKVLDFGLAKLTEHPAVAIDPEATTRAQAKTSAGMVVGTVTYMSPEQTRGEKVDVRTDIWSLGVLLYEMVAGCAPFERSTPSEVIALILEREPAPLSQYARGVPSELERIISKALTKDREQRYQTAKDLQIDLRRLQHRLELETGSEHFASLRLSGGRPVTGYAHVEMAPADSFAARSEMARPTSSAEYLVSQIKQHKWSVISATIMLLIVTIGGGFVWYRLFGHRLFRQLPRPFAPSPSMTINRLTNSGRATAAAISADGNYVVYGLEDGGKQSLWLRQVKSTSEKEIVAPQETHLVGPAFSHDGNLIYYTAAPRNVLANITFRGVLYQVPTLGGTPRKVVENVNGPVALSPDGRRIAFIRTSEGEPHVDALMVASVDGTGERQLTTKRDKAYLDPNPAWSPDGKTIICGAGVEPDYFYESILEVSAEDGKERWLTAHKWFQVSRLAWLTDRSGLIAVAHEKLGRGSQIWHVSYPAGDVQRITHDLNGYGNNQELSASLSLTADSKNLVVVQHDSTSKIWVTATGEDESRARAISTGKLDGDAGV
jgi:eukaryotic-like serine/threonine-protein kinase